MSNIKIICVDFDQTLSLVNEYPHCGNPCYEGFEVLKKFRNNGGKLILWTCRNGVPLQKAIDFCKYYGLEFDAINDSIKEDLEAWTLKHPENSPSRKVYADMYIDDKDPRALKYGIDWNLIEEVIFKEKNEKVS